MNYEMLPLPYKSLMPPNIKETHINFTQALQYKQMCVEYRLLQGIMGSIRQFVSISPYYYTGSEVTDADKCSILRLCFSFPLALPPLSFLQSVSNFHYRLRKVFLRLLKQVCLP